MRRAASAVLPLAAMSSTSSQPAPSSVGPFTWPGGTSQARDRS
jgi:hypothetical protein